MAVGMPLLTTALMGVNTLEARKNRRQDREERKKMKAEQDKQFKQKAMEEMNAKKSQYDQSRSISRRGAQRGRMSTVLNQSDTLG